MRAASSVLKVLHMGNSSSSRYARVRLLPRICTDRPNRPPEPASSAVKRCCQLSPLASLAPPSPVYFFTIPPHPVKANAAEP